jgi:hypothetical protein
MKVFPDDAGKRVWVRQDRSEASDMAGAAQYAYASGYVDRTRSVALGTIRENDYRWYEFKVTKNASDERTCVRNG